MRVFISAPRYWCLAHFSTNHVSCVFRESSVTSSRTWPLSLALLWLIGVALRLAILAVPPAIPALREEFSLTGTEIGALSGTPIVIFAVASLAGSRLVARIGVIAAATAGLLLTALGSASRSLAFDTVGLFAATVVMGMGVAVAQPAMPALVGRWLPKRLVLGTGVYTNGLLVGEILPVALPLLVPAFADNWRVTFALWAAPIVAIAVLTLMLAPREEAATVAGVSGRWWPDWPAWDVWRLGLIFGGVGPLYFGTNAFLPGYLSEAGRADLINPALTALNLGQLPASFLLIAFSRRIESRAWPFILASVVGLAGIGAIVMTASALTVVSAAVVGFAAGAAFALGLTLPPLLSKPEEVARVAAAMFTISYASTVLVSLICGALWDATATARAAFLPIIVATLLPIVLIPTIRFDRGMRVGV
jgi:CP family cyanate transporter-like MFS transporter